MGLDVGSKTVGVAISDPLGFTAQGLEIIQINEDQGEFGFERLKELVDSYKVERFVVGLPKNITIPADRAWKRVKHMEQNWKNSLVCQWSTKMSA